MSNSYPFLFLSRTLRRPYGQILDRADEMFRLSDGLLVEILMSTGENAVERAVARAVFNEKQRRLTVLKTPPPGACS